jgi:hypothetical protein
MTIVDEEDAEPGEMLDGLKVHVRPEGALQERETCPLKPPNALAPIMRFVDPPAETVAVIAERFRVKSGPAAAAAGATLANTLVELPPVGKLGWLPPPAVK